MNTIKSFTGSRFLKNALRVHLLFPLGLILLPPLAVRADTTEIVASDNAYVLRGNGDQSEAQTLSTKRLNDSNTRVAYVRFDLTSFLTTHNISGITAATLRLYESSGTADTMKVYGLDSTIGGTNEFDDTWTGVMSFATQPAGNLANSSTALPNGNTTIVLASQAIPVATAEMDITLSLADFKSFLTTNGDAKITLIFHNTGNNSPTAASLANTGGFLQPTLELVAPVLANATVTWSGAASGDWDTNTLNWTSTGSPTNFLQGNSAIFDDTLLGNSVINLTMSLLPLNTTVSNSATDYTFAGSGSLVGGLFKYGTRKLIIDNSGANGFSALTISNGTVQIGNNDTNGNLGTATVTNYASLVVNRNDNVVLNNNIVGTGNVIQNGSGALTLSGTTAYTGATIVNSGTLAVNALSTLGLLTNAPGSVIAVAGSNAGPVFVNGTLAPGNFDAAGVLGAGSGVTLGSTAVLSFDLGPTNTPGGGVNDLLVVNGNLAENGTLKAVPTLGVPLLGVPYTLAQFGSASGSFTATNGGHFTATLNQTPTNLTVTFSGSGANLKWNSASSSSWDAGVTTNWLNGAALDYFYQGDTVTFDDTASQTAVTLAGTMSPVSLTVNSTANNYLIGGGKISGAANLVKSGASTLTLSNANDFTGTVTVNAGTLKIGNNAALGATNGSTTVASGATLDVNAHNVGQEQIYISGIGVTNSDGTTNGAIINSSQTAIFPAVQRVTLQGDTVFGAPTEGALAPTAVYSNRWDLRSLTSTDANGGSLSTSGNAYNVTKVGLNQVGLVGLTVDPALGNIDVRGGILSIEAATTGLGNPAKTLTVESGTTLSIFQATNQFNKNIVLNGGGLNTFGGSSSLGTINSQSGNNTIAGPMTLNGSVEITFRNNNLGATAAGGTLTLAGTMTGSGSLTKEDTNTLFETSASDNHSGGTTINDGTFVLNGISGNAANTLTINTHTLAVPTILGGNGTNIGPVGINDTLWPGVGGTPSTFGAGSGSGTAMQFNSAQSVIFSLGSTTTTGGGVNDLLNIRGDFDPAFSFIYINPVGLLNTNGTYTLVKYTGNLVNNFNNGVAIAPSFGASRYQFSLSYPANAVALTVSGGPTSLEWNNAANTGVWDVNNNANWSNTVSQAASDRFYNLDTVVFDDTILNSATPTNIITIATNNAVMPQAITVNASAVNYSMVGPGKISGAGGLVKQGSGTLTLAAANDYTGNTTILAGAVAVTNNSSLGATNGTVFVTNGGSLFLTPATANNGLNFAAKPFVISGTGVGGNGVIFNAGTNQQNAFQNVTMAGDSTFGGSARWDIRSPAVTNAGATLSTGGHAYKLTKLGANFIALSSVNVDPALGDIDVQSGTLSIETQTASLGNPANKVTVFNGATLELWNLTNVVNKPIVLQSGSTVLNGAGNNTYSGGVTVQGDSTLNVGGVGLTLSSSISGSGNLMRSGAALLTLTANSPISGGVLLNTGTTTLNGSGAFSASTNVFIASGATLDVSGRGDLTLTLNSGQMVSGSGNITGKLTGNAGSTLSPGGKGVIGTLTASSSAVLNGTSYMEVTNNGASLDRLTCGSVAFGGTLVVSNLDLTHPFTTNSALQLFSAGTYSGAFTNIMPANPNNDPSLAWDTNSLTVNGTLKISAVITGPPPTPRITGISLSGTTLVLNATNGAVGGQYLLLSTTNVASPLNQWQTNVTGNFDGNGNLNLSTNIVSPSDAQKFYILKQ